MALPLRVFGTRRDWLLERRRLIERRSLPLPMQSGLVRNLSVPVVFPSRYSWKIRLQFCLRIFHGSDSLIHFQLDRPGANEEATAGALYSGSTTGKPVLLRVAHLSTERDNEKKSRQAFSLISVYYINTVSFLIREKAVSYW